MTLEELEDKYPLILGWIDETLAKYRSQAQVVGTLGFKRLSQYFSAKLLGSAKVVYVPAVPLPPLRALGLEELAEFEELDAGGVTYLDTFFSWDSLREDEAHHFHELIHVTQWRLLGAKNFLAAYADGLLRFGYRESPLEMTAYSLEERFRSELIPFPAEAIIAEQLNATAWESSK